MVASDSTREPALERAMPADAVPGSTIPEDTEAEILLQDGTWAWAQVTGQRKDRHGRWCVGLRWYASPAVGGREGWYLYDPQLIRRQLTLHYPRDECRDCPYAGVMSLGAGRQRAVGEELAETLEDVSEGGIGSRVVLVAVPAGWGRSTVLEQFAPVAVADDGPAVLASADDGPVVLVARISGNLPPGRAVQAVALREGLEKVVREPWLVRRLGLDTAAGRVVLGLGLGGLVASGPGAAAGLLVASLAVTAAGSAWDDSPSGEDGGVARAARVLARLSVQVPVVVVVIDDADCLDPGLALALIGGLAGRQDGRVLVVAAAAPGSDLAGALTRDPGYDLAGRVQRAEANPSMEYADRVELAAELLPHLPAAGIERIARRTATFTEVFAVAGAGRLAELGPEAETAEAVTVVDAVADGVLERAAPSPEAKTLAWAGGALHERQARQALQVLGEIRQKDDPRVVRAGSLVRLAGPADGRLTGLVTSGLAAADRQNMAAVVLGEAAGLAADAGAGLVDWVVARQAAHHVRDDLTDRSGLTGVQIGLIRGLEKLGDRGAAYEVATTALAELEALPPTARDAGQRQDLLMAKLRLARTRPGRGQGDDPAVTEAVELAVSGGAAVGPKPACGPRSTCCTGPATARTGSGWPARSPPNWKPDPSTAISPRSGGCCWPSTPARPATPPWPSGCWPR